MRSAGACAVPAEEVCGGHASGWYPAVAGLPAQQDWAALLQMARESGSQCCLQGKYCSPAA